MKILDLGCGLKIDGHKYPNSIGVDILKDSMADVIADAKQLPFKESSIDFVYCSHLLEHEIDFMQILKEIWRVCKHGAKLHIKTPHFSSNTAWSPEHKRAFSYLSFLDMVRHPFYKRYFNFKLVSGKLKWFIGGEKDWKSKSIFLIVLSRVINYIANLRPTIFERFFCYYVGGMGEIEIIYEIVK